MLNVGKRKMKKQLWINIERQIRKFYPEQYDEIDIKISKAFFKSGWNVYPESGYMFQKFAEFGDGSKNEACISIEEARELNKQISLIK